MTTDLYGEAPDGYRGRHERPDTPSALHPEAWRHLLTAAVASLSGAPDHYTRAMAAAVAVLVVEQGMEPIEARALLAVHAPDADDAAMDHLVTAEYVDYCTDPGGHAALDAGAAQEWRMPVPWPVRVCPWCSAPKDLAEGGA